MGKTTGGNDAWENDGGKTTPGKRRRENDAWENDACQLFRGLGNLR